MPKRDNPKDDNERGFGSAHDGICNFTFSDGSVRALSYTIKGSVFKAVITRDGAEELNAGDF